MAKRPKTMKERRATATRISMRVKAECVKREA
jgi:hypothetical protein